MHRLRFCCPPCLVLDHDHIHHVMISLCTKEPYYTPRQIGNWAEHIEVWGTEPWWGMATDPTQSVAFELCWRINTKADLELAADWVGRYWSPWPMPWTHKTFPQYLGKRSWPLDISKDGLLGQPIQPKNKFARLLLDTDCVSLAGRTDARSSQGRNATANGKYIKGQYTLQSSIINTKGSGISCGMPALRPIPTHACSRWQPARMMTWQSQRATATYAPLVLAVSQAHQCWKDGVKNQLQETRLPRSIVWNLME